MKTKKTIPPANDDSLFAQAAEDITLLAETVENWSASGDKAGSLVALAAGYGRGRLALAKLVGLGTNQDQKYFQKLEKIFTQVENSIPKLLAESGDDLARCFAKDGPLWQQLQAAEHNLRAVREISRDGLAFQNLDWQHDELIQNGQDFLVLFEELAWLARWSEPMLSSLNGYYEWRREFEQVESLFRNWFGYFQPLDALLAALRDRDYGAAFWWLMTAPAQEMTTDVSLTDEQIQAMGRVLRQAGITPEPCPEQFVIALALNDPLSAKEVKKTRAHMNKCLACRGLHQSMLAVSAEAEAAIKGKTAAQPPKELLARIRGDQRQTIRYNTPEEFLAAVKAVPKWQRQNQIAEDQVIKTPEVKPHPVMFDFPDVSKMRHLSRTGGWPAVLQELRVVPYSLMAHAATEKGTGVWAKIGRIANNVIQELSVVELEVVDVTPQESKVTFTGALPSWLRLPEQIQWLCDLLKPDGTVLAPIEQQTEDRFFTATFPRDKKKKHRAGPDQYELRVLILVYG